MERDVRVTNPSVMPRRTIVGDFVHHQDLIFQRDESVCKADKNVELAAGFG
jgi:hypothetical protein